MSNKVQIDTEGSVRCEPCVELCPDLLGFGDAGEKPFSLGPPWSAWEECIEKAMEICPAQCIHGEV